MKTTYRLALCAALTLATGSVSRAQHFDWAIGWGGFGNTTETANDVHVDGVGNIYLTGQFGETVDFDLGPDTYPLGPTAGDVFVAKYSKDLDFFWAVRFGGAPPDAGAWSMAVTSDIPGNVYVVGHFVGTVDFDPGVGVANLTQGPGAMDAFVVKLNSSGGLVWARRLGGGTFNEGHRVMVDSSGNVYTVGHFSGTSDFDPGPGSFPLTSGVGFYAAFVSKLDGGGNFIWARALTGSGGTYGFGLARVPGGDVVVGGNLYGTVDFDPGPGVSNLSSVGQADAYVARLTTGGALVWARAFGGATNESVADLAADINGNVFLAGQFEGTVDFDPGVGVSSMTVGGGTSDAYVARYGMDGSFQWARQLGGTGSQTEVPRGVGTDDAGNAYVAGDFIGTADFDPAAGTFPLTSTGDGGTDLFATSLDGAGTFRWAARMGGSCAGAGCICCGDDRGYGMTVDPTGHTYMSGTFRGRGDFDPSNNFTFFLTSQGMSDDFFLSKLSPTPLSAAVPDGASTPGVMLTLEKGPSNIIFRWGASCRAADRFYELYEGTLGNWTSHVPLVCNVFGTAVGRVPGAGDRYYLVVPTNGTIEGSYGVDGDGNERPASSSACHPQSYSACVP